MFAATAACMQASSNSWLEIKTDDFASFAAVTMVFTWRIRCKRQGNTFKQV